jgi:hypothetical protein
MSDFNSIQNKGIIWELLIEQNLFEGIDQKYKLEIKDLFEQTILIIEKQGRGLSLIEKNKEVIKNMVIKLEVFKKQSNVNNHPRQYTNEDLQRERQNAFERELKRKQTEFDGLTRKIPEKIDFADKLDEKIGDKMDLLLAETIAMREKQLNQVIQTHNPDNASKWIENGNKIGNVLLDEQNDQHIKNLKIGQDTNIQENQIVNLDKKQQRVTFNENNNKIHNYIEESLPNIPIIDIGLNFLSMLKKEPDSSNDNNFEYNSIINEVNQPQSKDAEDMKREIIKINNKINDIYSKQEEIIRLLRSIVKL